MRLLNILFILVLVLGLTSCTKPYHSGGTELINVNELASISYNGDELQIIGIDGIKFVGDGKTHINPPFGSKGMPFYIKQGKHKISSIIDWKDMHFVGNISFETSYKNYNVINICVELKPKKDYYLYARKRKGENWKVLVSDSTNGLSLDFPDVKTIPCK